MPDPINDTNYPKLRFVDAFPIDTEDRQMVGLRDPSGISPETLMLSPDVFYLLQFFDGKHASADLKHEYMRAFGSYLQEEKLEQILNYLDAHLFLDNQNFHTKLAELEKAFLDLPARPAVHAGQSYEADPDKLMKQIQGFFESEAGAGLPQSNGRTRTIKGLIAPHIDIRAGGPCYSHAYRALAESEAADCYVILGTGHSGLSNLYSTLPKDFETPLGTVKYDACFIELLQANYPPIGNSEVLPHKMEHVIEFQLVFLKYLYQQKRNFTFVPILCSFSYHMLTDPRFDREREIAQNFSAALKKTISTYGKKVCLIASVDFSHIGQQYGDAESPGNAFVEKVRVFDHELIEDIEKLDAGAFCEKVASHEDRYRVCGFSSIYTLLNAIDAKEGKLLDYAKTEVDEQKSTVTFASMAFE